MAKEWGKGTICVQGGYDPKPGEPIVLPMVQSTTYKYSDPDHVAKLFDLEAEGHMYSRISNPTVEAYEKKVASLEGGVGALAVSSGQSATTLALLNICKSGDHIIASSAIYGGSFNLLSTTFKNFGIETTFVEPDASEEEILKEFKDNTKAIFGETLGNPSLEILDFNKFSKIAKEKQVPLIVDNTLATPFICKPLELGANIVVYSSTKYIEGHANSVGGIIVDGGNFNWDNGKFKELVEPDASYHGTKYVETFGNAAYIVKARVQLLRDLGNCLSPFNAFLTNLGLETLHLRIKRHSDNALKLAQFLSKHEKVSWVNYPGLEGNASYNNFKKYFSKDASGIVTFGIKGGIEAGNEFIRNLKLVSLVIHVGDTRTCVLQPSATTHRQLTEEEQIASGVYPDLIRVSLGIEDGEDILADFEQALAQI